VLSNAHLSFRNRGTGEAVDFSIDDDIGGLVETLGLDRNLQSGRNSWYEIDSSLSSAETNTVLMDKDRLSITFLDTNHEPVSIRVAKGAGPVRKKLIDLMTSYNSYMDWLTQNSQTISTRVKTKIIDNMRNPFTHGPVDNTSRIASSLQRLSSGIRIEAKSTLENELKTIGIKIDADARLNITDKFSEAIESDFKTVREVLGGEKGFFTRVSKNIEDILENDAEKYILDDNKYLAYNQQGHKAAYSSMIDRTTLFSLYI